MRKISIKPYCLFLTIFLFSLSSLFHGCNNSAKPAISPDKKRELANVLYNQQLYPQAVAEYQDYLSKYSLPDTEQANIMYMIANIYFDRLNDYENALSYYLRIKYLFPSSNLQGEVSKKTVECLERLERSTDAQQVIEQTAALDESQKPQNKPGEIIAKIGDRQITSGDLQFELSRLPVYLQDQIKTREQKLEFLKNYIAQELLFDSARRKGLEKNKEVREGVRQAEKSLMTQKLLQEEIENQIGENKYSNADVELYFKANKDNYSEKDENGKIIKTPSFEEVKEKVAQDFVQNKQQQIYQQLIERLMKAEEVIIYENKFQ
jgi:tetratricopeptide (TPR) repeat protein